MEFYQNNLTATGGNASTRVQGGDVIIESVTVSTADVHAPAADTAAVVTYAAVNGRHAIGGVAWSYTAAPTGGGLVIADGSDTILTLAITAAGPGYILFPQAKRGTAATAMTVTLAAPGGAVVGKVNVLTHWIEAP